VWNLIGKYHSHYLPIRDILFGSAASDSNAPRFFSLGEDQELVEYDLTHRLYRELHILLHYSWKLYQRCDVSIYSNEIFICIYKQHC